MVHTGIKVVLANPPTNDGELVIREGRCEQSGGLWATVWPPLTLATAAAFLENRGHRVSLYDCPVQEISPTDFINDLRNSNPDLIVLNVSTPTLNSDLILSEQLKRYLPDSHVIAIGTHVSALPDHVMRDFPFLDAVVIGEPEITISEIADAIAENGSFDSINGVLYRSETRLIRNPPRRFMENLNNLPVPSWHLVDLDKYLLPIYERRFLMISSGRGCPFGCSFCAAQTYYGSRLRLRSPSHIVKEIQTVKSRYGVSDFLFWTETFTLAKEQVLELCDLIISEKLDIKWTCNSRVDAIDMEILTRMKEAGCWMISFGIESASPHVLKKAGKQLNLESIFRAVKLAHNAGLQVTGHFILGLPGETVDSLQRTIGFAERLGVDFAQFYCAVPFPGSRLFEEALENGWIESMDWEKFDQTIANMSFPELTSDSVMTIRNRAIKRFYFRPGNIFRTLRRIDSIDEFKTLLRMFAQFVKSNK